MLSSAALGTGFHPQDCSLQLAGTFGAESRRLRDLVASDSMFVAGFRQLGAVFSGAQDELAHVAFELWIQMIETLLLPCFQLALPRSAVHFHESSVVVFVRSGPARAAMSEELDRAVGCGFGCRTRQWRRREIPWRRKQGVCGSMTIECDRDRKEAMLTAILLMGEIVFAQNPWRAVRERRSVSEDVVSRRSRSASGGLWRVGN